MHWHQSHRCVPRNTLSKDACTARPSNMAVLLCKPPAFTATTRRSACRFATSSGVRPRCRPNVATFAKSKSGKGGKQQKGSALDKLLKAKEEASGVAGDAGADVPLADQYNSPDVMMLLLVLTNSYWQSTKQCVRHSACPASDGC
jgi:hypothetical protein